MTSLVVFESMYGATRAVAEAIAAGLDQTGQVRVVEVGALAAESPGRLPDGVDLLVVGGPTHAFGMTRPQTRADADREAGPVVSAGIGVREWLEQVTLPAGVAHAAFDTKVAKPNLPGSAAKGIDKHLRRLGGRALTGPRTFTVHGKAGGLVDGQLEEARGWGASLGASRG